MANPDALYDEVIGPLIALGVFSSAGIQPASPELNGAQQALLSRITEDSKVAYDDLSTEERGQYSDVLTEVRQSPVISLQAFLLRATPSGQTVMAGLSNNTLGRFPETHRFSASSRIDFLNDVLGRE